jgi:hypothetical protein
MVRILTAAVLGLACGLSLTAGAWADDKKPDDETEVVGTLKKVVLPFTCEPAGAGPIVIWSVESGGKSYLLDLDAKDLDKAEILVGLLVSVRGRLHNGEIKVSALEELPVGCGLPPVAEPLPWPRLMDVQE